MKSRLLLALSFALGCASGEPPGTGPDARIVVELPDASIELADSAPVGRADANTLAPDAAPRPDATILPPDATVLPPDATVLPPDAAPGLPDATPVPDAMPPACTNMWINLLTNGSFDTGVSPWTESSSGGYPIIGPPPATATAHTAPNIAWLGGYDSGTDTVTQTVTVPADATSLRLRGQRIIGTAETDPIPFDYLYFRLLTAGGGVLENLGSYSNLDANATYLAFDFAAASSHAGETLQVQIQMVTDILYSTGAFVDTVTLEAFVCR